MPIFRKPRKSPLNDFVSMVVPDRVEEAFDRVDDYFTEHLKLSFETPEGVAGVLTELIHDHGFKVRKALYAMLCEENGPLRPLVSGATAGGVKSAVGFLVPVLAAQFALAPAVALLVATLVIKASAANGEKALCEELIRLNRKTTRHLDSIDPRKRAGQVRKASPRRKTAEAGGEQRPPRQRRKPGAETQPSAVRQRGQPETSAAAGAGQTTRKPRKPGAETAPTPVRQRSQPETGSSAAGAGQTTRKPRKPGTETTPTPVRQPRRPETGAAAGATQTVRKSHKPAAEDVVASPRPQSAETNAEKPRRRTNRKPTSNTDSH